MQNPIEKKQEIHTYVAQWAVYTLAWTTRSDKRNRLAVGSFLEDYANKIELINFSPSTTTTTTFSPSTTTIDHPYTPTNLMFFPSSNPTHPDLLATSGDHLRLWQINSNSTKVTHKTTLTTNKPPNNSTVTSFDWADHSLNLIATASVDTTCTIFDIDHESVDTQLVAHDKEVYDISWGGPGVFGSVSADGSVRVFDLRNKERSTIVYESNNPVVRLEWNKGDPRYIAAVGMDSERVVVLDIRVPTIPVMELGKHKACVNAVAWGTESGRYLCSVGDDGRVLIWDVVGACGMLNTGEEEDVDPVMWSGSSSEINNVRWSPVESDWIGITFLNKLQLLKV